MIEVKNLTKVYGSHKAVDDLNFTLQPGEIYGFLGPNGAGKSTTMNMLTGCLAATSGEVKIHGYDVFEEPLAAKRHIGYLPEQPPLYPDMTPAEYLHFVGRAKGLKKAELEKQVANALRRTELTEVQNRLIAHLSKGYRQRVGIAQAILGDPEIVILDEPTVGLDPKQILRIRKLICELGKTKTVILSSHILSEISAVCTQVLILHQGKLVANASMQSLESTLSPLQYLTLRVRASQGEDSKSKLEALLCGFSDLTGCVLTEEAGEAISCKLSAKLFSDDLCEQLSLALAAAGFAVLQMTTAAPGLESIFLTLAGDEGQAGPSPAEDAAPASKGKKEEKNA